MGVSRYFLVKWVGFRRKKTLDINAYGKIHILTANFNPPYLNEINTFMQRFLKCSNSKRLISTYFRHFCLGVGSEGMLSI